jgi:hypothetical protein
VQLIKLIYIIMLLGSSRGGTHVADQQMIDWSFFSMARLRLVTRRQSS